jgi:ABC-type multidrug transport system fused ATPase/permease subunit
VLIGDATSSVDASTGERHQVALAEGDGGGHVRRPPPLDDAGDEIMVLDHGRILARGRHDGATLARRRSSPPTNARRP